MNERIKELRAALGGISQREFGEALGIGKSAVCRIESGAVALTEANAIRICEKFNVRREWLLTGEGEIFQPEKPSLVSEVAAQYHLSNLETALLANYLALPEEDRRAIMKIASKVIDPALAACAAAAPDPVVTPPGSSSVQDAEAAYEKALGFAPSAGGTASSTIDDTASTGCPKKRNRHPARKGRGSVGRHL